MALNSINTNIAAYFAQQNINHSNSMTSASIGRLSSGNRIVRAADDVAAMSVGTSLRTQVSTLRMALLNASQGSSMLQVADGALSKVQDMLLRQKALATQATSGSLTATERGFLNQEFSNLTDEIDRLVDNTNFNGVNLLGGGLGASGQLTSTDVMSALFLGDGAGLIASTVAVQAINSDGTDASAVTAGPPALGGLTFVDATNVVLADADYLNINSGVYGSIGDFRVTNLVETVSATLSVTINGIEFTGTAAEAATTFVLENGNTRIMFATNTAIDTTDIGTINVNVNTLNTEFDEIEIMRTQLLHGADFSGTALDGAVGSAGAGIAMVRTADPSQVSISNFQYVSNDGTDHTLTVDVNGETWTAILAATDSVTTATQLFFSNGSGEGLQIDLAGMTGTITDIRTVMSDRAAFINGLNQGFSNIGGGVDFALGTEGSDKLTVSIRNAGTTNLYDGLSLNVNTVADAQVAGVQLNLAIAAVTAIRANVGAMQSRFDFASANIEISLQNQDAARGTLLDTDIASESSAYATAQVQLQAGIAVLAQANLLPQNLLKLIG